MARHHKQYTTNISCQWLFKVLSSVILKQNFWSSKNIWKFLRELFSNILSPLKYYSICNLLLIIVDNHQKLPKSVYKNARMKSHDKLGSESCLVKFHLTIISTLLPIIISINCQTFSEVTKRWYKVCRQRNWALTFLYKV